MEWQGRRVTIMGLGHFGGGLAAARWLARQGAEVTVTDLADEAVLARSLGALSDVPIARFCLADHREADFRRADAVVVNPAVRPDDPFLQTARAAGARLTSEIELFLEACPAPVIGVTGSNGKSTTAAMTVAILEADGRTAWLGGNIGSSLLEQVDEIGPDDCVVLELSSFQLHHLSANVPMPQVAVVTNCLPNHLDWHGSYDLYRTAKQRILAGQRAGDLAVLNTSDPEVCTWAGLVRGRQIPLIPPDEIPILAVPGEHNRIDAACAASAAMAAGCTREAVRRALESFCGLSHRLESIAVVEGRWFYDDSSSTTPDSTIAALEALEAPPWLLAGGRDKGLDFGRLAAAIVRRSRGAAFYGSVRQELCRQVLACMPGFACTPVETLGEALRWCWLRSGSGECIVLSPACSSHDQFQNYQVRGERFVELVHALRQPHRGGARCCAGEANRPKSSIELQDR
jgi:UDP-N-acetylmuramoylalanine--D-glutamate ligase